MGFPGEDQSLFLYASISKGSGFAVATAVAATVHEPSGGTSMVTLKDDGVCAFHDSYQPITNFVIDLCHHLQILTWLIGMVCSLPIIGLMKMVFTECR